MTLHEAIEKLLRQVGQPMTTTEIASELNKNQWYQKKDNSQIDPFQIHGRTKNYPSIFNRNGSTVSLKGQSNDKAFTPKAEIEEKKTSIGAISKDVLLLEKVLMNEKNFKSASIIDDLVPDDAGLYCLRLKESKKLPRPFNEILLERNHNIIYIGIASQSLNKRFLNQELRANGHGTFFRSIGAVLGYKPEKGSLLLKANKRNYTFSGSDEIKIIDWINDNLIANWVKYDGDIEGLETLLIQKYLPLLNIAKNPLSIRELSDLRSECVRIANSK